jgi:cobalt-zinc-cadmium efflux system outer membrane protein
MRCLRVGWIVLASGVPLSAQEADWKPRLAAAIARATTQNPEVAEQEARIGAARHRIGQSTALPDPEVEVAIQDIPPSDFSFSRDDFTMEKITARQRIPGAGKRPAQKRSAEADLDSVEAMHGDHVVRLAAEVADAFFTIAELDARTRILEESRERLTRVAASATERYRVGKGAQADVLRANLEVTAGDERLAGLAGERRMAAARFNALQALPPSAPIEPVAVPEEEPSIPAADDLVRDAQADSPAVAAAAAQARMAEEQRTLARLERRPDFTAMAYYAHRVDFEDLVGASIALNLPFFQPKRLREKEAEKEAELSGARASLQAARNEIRRGVAEAYADVVRSIEQARIYRDSILPQAETNARAAQEAYTVGQIDFLTYMRAALDLDMYSGELAMRRAGAWRALAALQKASGLPLIEGTPKPGEIHVEK